MEDKCKRSLWSVGDPKKKKKATKILCECNTQGCTIVMCSYNIAEIQYGLQLYWWEKG